MSAAPQAASPGRWLAIVATLVVVATLVAAFLVMRSPAVQREVTLDQRRVQELQRIGYAIDAYVVLHESLPPDLATLAAQPGSTVSLRDPVTAAPYAYQATGKDRYRVCADFSTDTAKTGEALMDSPGMSWAHGVGHQCFERVVQSRGNRPVEAMPAMPAVPAS